MELLPAEHIGVRHTDPWDLHGRDESAKCLGLKTSGADIQEIRRAIWNWDSALKGLIYAIICPRPQCKSSSVKRT